MAQRRSYIDSNLIINAVNRNNTDLARRAFSVLGDPGRSFIVSDFVELETLPKMRFNKQYDQVEFTEALFRKAEYVNSTRKIIHQAKRLAAAYGLAAMDSLHAACAIAAGADELLTFETPTKPFFRILPDVLKVVSLHSESGIYV